MKKNKGKKGAIPIIAVIIIVIAIGGAVYVGQKHLGQKPAIPLIEKEPKPTPKPPLEVNPTPSPWWGVNFSEAGNILNWDVQTESYTDDWTLLYEKPGNPAISVKLNFDENSICNVGEGDNKPCDKSKLNNGDRAKVEGNRTNDTVTVIKLEKL